MPRYLLDTNALLWLLWNSSRLGHTARGVIAAEGNRVFVSPISIYEIAYLSRMGRLAQPVPENLEAEVADRRFIVLDLTAGPGINPNFGGDYNGSGCIPRPILPHPGDGR